jgi:hypothetical protein
VPAFAFHSIARLNSKRKCVSPDSNDATGRAVVVENPVAGVRGDARPGNDDTDEVQRIGSADRESNYPGHPRDESHAAFRSLRAVQTVHPKSRDKTSAANLTTRFESMIEAQQHTPRQRHAFSFEQTFENYP